MKRHDAFKFYLLFCSAGQDTHVEQNSDQPHGYLNNAICLASLEW